MHGQYNAAPQSSEINIKAYPLQVRLFGISRIDLKRSRQLHSFTLHGGVMR